jgi:Cu+-exporting ATPase
VERGSVHPIARAIAVLDTSLHATDVVETAGTGVAGTVSGVRIEVSRRPAASFANATETKAAIDAAGATTIAIVSVENRSILVLGLEDEVRPEARAAIGVLTELGIETTLLSGDQEARVATVASELGIDRHVAEVTPEAKLQTIQTMKADQTGLVAMVGDGLNDVAALTAADVGIAMGSGTHASQSAASITILDDDPRAIGFAIQLGRRTYRNIQQNLGWAFGYNVILIPVAAFGLLNPMLAGTAMAFSSVSVVLNALRLRQLR